MTFKRYFIVFNIVLAAGLMVKLIDLSIKIWGDVESKSDPLAYTFTDVKKKPVPVVSQYRNIFGVKLSEAETDKISDKTSSDELLNELVTTHEIIRIMGIFITEDHRFTVVSIIYTKMTKPEETIKIGIGDTLGDVSDKLKGFSVDAIQPGSVTLASASSPAIRLKLFEPLNDSSSVVKQ